MADDATPEQPANDEPAKKPYYDYHQQEADKHQQQALIDEQVAADVMHNPHYDEFFAPYRPAVRVHFVRDYVIRRQLWSQFGDFYERHLAGQLTQFEHEAYVRLWDIQQKKLFDLQCEWRAELVAVPDVRTSADFDTLSGRIENCEAIPPITPAELEIYMDWVRQADYEQDIHDDWGGRFCWQQYDGIKALLDPETDADGGFMSGKLSEWYDFHNQRTGNGRLLNLPNLRGAKEKRYLDAWREHNRAEREAEREAEPAPATPPAPPDPRPAYLGHEDALALFGAFAQRFESAAINRQRTAYEAANPPGSWEDDELERALDFLKGVDEPVSIEAGDDWRLALRRAGYAFRHRKLLASLPLVYDAYCQRLEWRIAQPPRSEREPDDLVMWHNKALLEGRAVLGEPQDFDF